MPIRVRLLLIFSSLFMLMLMMGIVFYSQMKKLSEPLSHSIPASIEEFSIGSKKTDFIYHLLYQHTLINRSLASYVLTKDPTFLQNYYENIELEDDLLDQTKLIDPILWKDLENQLAVVMTIRSAIIQAMQMNDDTKAKALMNQYIYVANLNSLTRLLNNSYTGYRGLVTEKASVNAKIGEKTANTILTNGVRINFIIFVAIILVSLLIAIVGAYAISRPIIMLRKNIERLSQNLDLPIDPELTEVKGEVGELAKSFVMLMSKLHASEQYKLIAQESNRLKSEFLANVSHELRTPLNGIKGFSELIMLDKVNPIHPKHKEYFDHITSCTEHLTRMINDILDVAKIESGTLEFHPHLIDVSVIVNQVTDETAVNIEEKNLKLTVEIDKSLNQVMIDPARFKQILYHYLSNAIKFTPEDGSILIRVTRESENYFILEVTDTGIGIAEENIPKLFQVFQPVDASSKKRYQGTGLGLALALRIAESQGGSVWVKSVLGKGSSFFARLSIYTQ